MEASGGVNVGAIASWMAVAIAAGAGLYRLEGAAVANEAVASGDASRRVHRAVWRWMIPVALQLLLVVGEQVPGLGMIAFPLYGIAKALVFVATLGTLVALAPLALYAAVNGAKRRGVVRFVLGMCVVGPLSGLVMFLEIDLTERGVATFCSRSEPVALAIETFARDRGAPPDSLAQLLPAYLGALPKRPSGRFGPLEYESVAAEDTVRVWLHYPLRKRAEHEDDWDVPRLTVRTDLTGLISEVAISPIDSTLGDEPFVPEMWRDSLPERARMARTAAALGVVGSPLDSLVAVLGPPADRVVAGQPRWRLQSRMNKMLGNDWLVRTSNDQQPDGYYDSDPGRVGRWWWFRGE